MAKKAPRFFDPDDPASLPVVQLVSAGEPIYAGQVNRTWRAMVQSPGSLEPAIPVALKYMESHVRLAMELGCSLAAHALKLPVPRGMLVLANPDELRGLPPEARRLSGRTEVLCYGSVLRWPEDTAERGIEDDARVEDFIWQRFCETKTAAPGAAWDELVANDDRHTRNFIFDGARYWLIDHELALRPLAESVRTLAQAATRQLILDHRAPRNQVAAQLRSRRPADHGMLTQPPAFQARIKTLEALALRMKTWRTGAAAIDAVLEDAETILRGIILRLPALGEQLTRRVATTSGPLLWESSTESSNNR